MHTQSIQFVCHIAVSHTIAYFFAGIFALAFLRLYCMWQFLPAYPICGTKLKGITLMQLQLYLYRLSYS